MDMMMRRGVGVGTNENDWRNGCENIKRIKNMFIDFYYEKRDSEYFMNIMKNDIPSVSFKGFKKNIECHSYYGLREVENGIVNNVLDILMSGGGNCYTAMSDFQKYIKNIFDVEAKFSKREITKFKSVYGWIRYYNNYYKEIGGNSFSDIRNTYLFNYLGYVLIVYFVDYKSGK